MPGFIEELLQDRSVNKLVGRQKELDTIDELLAALASGRGGTLFLSGEPGIGKSTLARALGEKARSKGHSVYWGFCWESGGAPAYWPWTQVIHQLVSNADIAEELVTNLGQLFPESGDSSDAMELQPDLARFQLLEAVRELLDRISRDNPVVIALDDLHSADADSLFLLQYLAKHAAGMPLLLVGTYRELEARQSASTESLWKAGRDAHILHLGRLNQEAVEEYLASAGTIDKETVRNVHETTGGNPLFLTELVDLRGRLRGEQLPETIQQVIEQQISLLPAQSAKTLGQASVLGREFDLPVLAFLRDQDESTTEQQIEAAASAGLIHAVRPGRYRYSHVLHRDVLYQGLGTTTREELHVRCATYMRSLIDDGAKDSWSMRAVHLQAAGSCYRNDAVAAWKMAAERAHARLAYEEAAQCLQNALNTFGQGPKFDPVTRCELQLQCALALLLAGHIQMGQAHCREVFATTRTLEDPALMSEAALTYGTALVVGHIDKELIGMLQECLEMLPDGNDACRARVQARLAAALQPAVDPSGPVKMAHEAIALARTTDDESVLFGVLKTAISALMDFAPALERIPLNREFALLAEKRRNAAEQFRSYLRLMIDAVDTTDRQLFDESIDAAERIAQRINLPHYLWRTTSLRASQAIIDGRFANALDLLDQAQTHADRAGNLESLITLPLQRFAILREWRDERAPMLKEVEVQLRHAYASGMGEVEFFINPIIAVYSGTNDATAALRLLRDESVIKRALGSGDHFTASTIGEFAAQVGYMEIARRAYEQILPHATECCSLGLMGGGLFRPIAQSLGIIARGLGQLEDAHRHFETALSIVNRMRALPAQAHIHAELAEVETARGNASAAHEHQRAAQNLAQALDLRGVEIAPVTADGDARGSAEDRLEMRLEGDIRTICFEGRSTSLRDSKGLQLLEQLVSQPGREVHVLDLVGASRDAAASDSGPALDGLARDEYRRHVSDLQEELEEAESLADTGRVDALRDELDFITRELARAYGLGGRERPSGSASERARVNVRRRLKDAIERIGEQIPDAGVYLENTIKTGTYCKYNPM
jgi:tetratricopeptide (TPR) repeat protein